jgi:hypothetical protein
MNDVYDTTPYNIQDEIKQNDDIPKTQDYLYTGQQMTLTCETDIDLGGQKETRQSTSGYMLYLNGALIHWRGRTEKIIIQSTAAGEYIALSRGNTACKFVSDILQFYGNTSNIYHIYTDNQAAEHIATQPTMNEHSRSIDIRHHAIRQDYLNSKLRIGGVKSEDNTSDILTKYLQAHLHRTHTKYLHLLLPLDKTNKTKQAQTEQQNNTTQKRQQQQKHKTLTSQNKETQDTDGQLSHGEAPEQPGKKNKQKKFTQGEQVSKHNNEGSNFKQCTLKITKHNKHNTCAVVQVHNQGQQSPPPSRDTKDTGQTHEKHTQLFKRMSEPTTRRRTSTNNAMSRHRQSKQHTWAAYDFPRHSHDWRYPPKITNDTWIQARRKTNESGVNKQQNTTPHPYTNTNPGELHETCENNPKRCFAPPHHCQSERTHMVVTCEAKRKGRNESKQTGRAKKHTGRRRKSGQKQQNTEQKRSSNPHHPLPTHSYSPQHGPNHSTLQKARIRGVEQRSEAVSKLHLTNMGVVGNFSLAKNPKIGNFRPIKTQLTQLNPNALPWPPHHLAYNERLPATTREQRPRQDGVRQYQNRLNTKESQFKSLAHHKRTRKMKSTPETRAPHTVFATKVTTKQESKVARQLRTMIRNEQRHREAKLAQRDAIVNVQAQFFDALEYLYKWPLDQLTFASSIQLLDAWSVHLNEARRCAYRAETIDPNHFGHLRYDIMSEIVMLETRRIEEFLQSFDHYKAIICDDITADDETYCDAEMIYYLNDVETNVVLDVIPQWVTEARRPPLTWYGFLSKHSEVTKIPPRLERILAPEYYTELTEVLEGSLT